MCFVVTASLVYRTAGKVNCRSRVDEKRWKSGSELLEFDDVQMYFDELFQSFGNFL
jgi:hypothetical protein